MGASYAVPRCEANATCAGGSGICDDLGSKCVCNDPLFSDFADFKRSTGCSVSIPWFQALWGINLVIWIASAFIGVFAWVVVKRRTARSDRTERVHIATCLIACAFAIALSAVELSTGSGLIAIDHSVSIVFGLAQLSYWAALLIKPSTRSETSVARFAMEQSKAIMQSYFALLPLLIALLIGSTIAVWIGSTDPILEEPVILAYYILFTLVFLLVAYHIGVSMVATRRRMEVTMMTSAMVSKRSSVKVRVEKFFRRAKRVMAITFVICATLELVPLIFASCKPCWNFLWLWAPSMSIVVAIWTFRAVIISAKFSLSTRRAMKESQSQRKMVNGDGEENLSSESRSKANRDKRPSPPPSASVWRKQQRQMVAAMKSGDSSSSIHKTDSMSSSSSSVSSMLSRSGSKKASRNAKKKVMTVVQEADYEGTVVLTQVESAVDHKSQLEGLNNDKQQQPLSPATSMTTMIVEQRLGSSTTSNSGHHTHPVLSEEDEESG